MSIQKANIKKHIANKPTFTPTSNSSANNKSLIGGPMFKMAQEFAEDMSANYKVGIIAVVYVILSGVVANVIWIIKLINLI